MQALLVRDERAHALAPMLRLQSEAGDARLLAGGPDVVASRAFHLSTTIELTRCFGNDTGRRLDAKVLHPSAIWQALAARRNADRAFTRRMRCAS